MKGKKYLFSILAIALLMTGTTFISYAFFSYTKEGEVQQVKTATTVVSFADGEEVSVDNAIPVTTAVGTAASGDYEFTFTISQTNSTSTAFNYYVYLVPGTAVSGKTRLSGNIVNFKLGTTTGSTGVTSFTSSYTSGALLSSFDGTNPLLVGYGALPASVSSSKSYTFTGYMWIDDANVEISDTIKRLTEGSISKGDSSADTATQSGNVCYPATTAQAAQYIVRTSEYNDHYFNAKLVVEVFDSASDTLGTSGHTSPVNYQ